MAQKNKEGVCPCMLNCFSHVLLFATLWTVAHQASLSVGFSRQEHWNGLLCPPPGDLPNPGIKPASLKSSTLAGKLFTTSATWEFPQGPSFLSDPFMTFFPQAPSRPLLCPCLPQGLYVRKMWLPPGTKKMLVFYKIP